MKRGGGGDAGRNRLSPHLSVKGHEVTPMFPGVHQPAAGRI